MSAAANNYLRKKSLFFCGIPTMIICFIIFMIICRQPYTLAAVAADFPIGCFITIFLCCFLSSLGFKSDVKKGHAPLLGVNIKEHAFYRRLPENLLLQALWLAVWGTLKYIMIPLGLLLCFWPNVVFAPIIYIIIKSFYSAVFVTACVRRSAEFNVARIQLQNNNIVE